MLFLHPRMKQGSGFSCKCSGSYEGKLVTGEQLGLAGVCSDRASAA